MNRRPGAGDLKAQPAVGPDSPGLAAGRRVSRGCSGVAEGAIVGVEPNAWRKHCVDPCIELIGPDMRRTFDLQAKTYFCGRLDIILPRYYFT